MRLSVSQLRCIITEADVSESVMGKKMYRLMPEIKAEFEGYLGDMFGAENVRTTYDGVKNKAIEITHPADDAVLKDVAHELAGIIQVYTGEEATIESKVNWSAPDGQVYEVETRNLFVTMRRHNATIFVHISPKRW